MSSGMTLFLVNALLRMLAGVMIGILCGFLAQTYPRPFSFLGALAVAIPIAWWIDRTFGLKVESPNS